MGKRYKFRKKNNSVFKIKYLLFILLIYLSYDLTYTSLINSKIPINNEMFLKMILSEGNHNTIYQYQPKKILGGLITLVSNINLNKPASILGINFIDKSALAFNEDPVSDNDDYNPNELEKITKYIKDPNPSIINNPRVYIYNSHQLENYDPENLEIYNITPNVMMASYMLKEKLNNLGIYSLAEEANLTEFMRINNWSHADSYKASRIFILDTKNKYDSLEYFIDIHRDSVKKKVTTVTIDGKNYAKTLFVVGLENPNYKNNLALAESLNKIIKEKYPGLSRGILKKQGPGVDGVYNQDISSKMILLEVGGVDNNIEEVLNTIEAFSKVLYEYLEEA